MLPVQFHEGLVGKTTILNHLFYPGAARFPG